MQCTASQTPTNLLPTIIAGAITLVLFVATLFWQRHMMNQERRQREKEATERLLREKMERLFMSTRQLSETYSDVIKALPSKDLRVTDAHVLSAKEGINELRMLELYYFPFLELRKMLPSDTIFGMNDALEVFAKDARNVFPDHLPQNWFENKVVNEAFDKLRTAIESGTEELVRILFRLPNLDLYKLSIEWKKETKKKKSDSSTATEA